MKILIAGDFCDKYRVTDAISHRNFGLMFDDIVGVVSHADYSIVNFEFPIVNDSAIAIKKCGPNLSGQESSVEAIKYAGFKCCTLAINHILDYGCNCGIYTKTIIENNGLDTVGFGLDDNDARGILYKQIGDSILAIINCCEHEFSTATGMSAGTNELNPIKQYYSIKEAKNNADFVLVIVHGGHEMHQLPSPRMKELYRFFIDCGADAVVNHHQHCFSGFEQYSGKPIFYGLGNFLFDSKSYRNNIWNYGFMLELTFISNRNPEYNLIPYIQCSDAPAVKLLNENQKEDFKRKFDELSAIIADDKRLQTMTDEYYCGCLKNEIGVLEPYCSRISRKLLNLGLLPRFVKDEKLLMMLNHINCESHRDKLIFALNHSIK